MPPVVDPETVDGRPAADATGVPTDGARRRRTDPVRLVCHLAAELPLVILCARSMSTGWRATADDAVAAWRAWNVMSAHPTLLGAPTHTSGQVHQAFAPGPALSWLLAVPVRIDPTSGTLWGSTLIALVAVALAIEAGWAAGTRWGAIGVAAAVLTLVTTETAVLMNLPWTPWQGALWLLAALACAWATSSGSWTWWPACVMAASIAAQAHVVFLLTAVAVCAVSPILAVVIDSRRFGTPARADRADATRRIRSARPLLIGLAVGLLMWLPTLIDEFGNDPGNLTLLWRASRAPGGRINYSHAMQGLGAASVPPFSWTHRLPTTGGDTFLSVLRTTFHGPSWRGPAALLVLVVLGLWCLIARQRTVAAIVWVSVIAAAATAVTIAQTPSSDALELVYLGVVYWPVGLAMTGAAAAGLVAVIRHETIPRLRLARIGMGNSALTAMCVIGLVGLSIGVTVVDGGSVPNSISVQGGPGVGVLADRATAAVVKVAPRGPFEVELTGPSAADVSWAAYPAVAYRLATKGLHVRLPVRSAVGIDAGLPATGDLTVVSVDIGTGGPTARLSRTACSTRRGCRPG